MVSCHGPAALKTPKDPAQAVVAAPTAEFFVGKDKGSRSAKHPEGGARSNRIWPKESSGENGAALDPSGRPGRQRWRPPLWWWQRRASSAGRPMAAEHGLACNIKQDS